MAKPSQAGGIATEVTAHEAKSQLSKLIDSAMQGEEVIIRQSKAPVVKLTPIRKKGGLRLGSLEGPAGNISDFWSRWTRASLPHGKANTRMILDTHALLWAQPEPRGLSSAARNGLHIAASVTA